MCICVVLVGVLGNDENFLYMLVLLCSSNSIFIFCVGMAEGWLRDSGPIKLFLEQIGPSIRRSHINEKL